MMRQSMTFTIIYIFFIYFCHWQASPCEAQSNKPYITKESSNIKYIKSHIPQAEWSNPGIWKSINDTKSSAAFTVAINDKYPPYKFILYGQLQGDTYLPSYLEIVNSSMNKVVQKLPAKSNFDNHGDGYTALDLFFANMIDFCDLNGDGYLDLRILYNTGATGNNWYATYLYQPKQGRFKYHKDLSSLSAVHVDKDTKLITTYWRSGWCSEVREYFSISKNDRLILEKVEWSEIIIDEGNMTRDCYKFTALPKPRDIRMTNIGAVFYYHLPEEYYQTLHKEMKVIRKEVSKGSLDKKERTVMGNPIENDLVPIK